MEWFKVKDYHRVTFNYNNIKSITFFINKSTITFTSAMDCAYHY